MLEGLHALRDRYGAHHGVTYSDQALMAIVDAAEPGDESGCWQRALDLLDRAGAHLSLGSNGSEVSEETIDQLSG